MQMLSTDNPHVGAWKMDVERSTFSPGYVPSRSDTARIETVGAGQKVMVEQVAADGRVTRWEYTANFDGKDYPITGGSNDTVALTRIDFRTIQSVFKKAGTVTATQIAVVSSDGKTLTRTTKAVNAAGQTVDRTTVFLRQ
jgi:hypothetical protein